jgi:hypothetical protein
MELPGARRCPRWGATAARRRPEDHANKKAFKKRKTPPDFDGAFPWSEPGHKGRTLPDAF